MKKFSRWITRHDSFRELALFLIALSGLGLSITVFIQGVREESVRETIEVERYLDEANDLLGNNVHQLFRTGMEEPEKVVRAQRLIRDALEKDPTNERAYFLRGMVGIAMREPKIAADAFDKVYELVPDKPDALNGFGMYADAFGLKDDAVKFYREALSKEPTNSVLKANLAGALIGKGERAEAKLLLQELVRQYPTECGVREILGEVLSGLGELAEALRHLQVAASLCPTSQVIQMNLGHVLFKERRLADALEAYELASTLEPSYGGSYLSIGQVQQELGLLDAARDSFELALKKRPHFAVAQMRIGFLLASNGQYAEALERYQQALSDNKEYLQVDPLPISPLYALMSYAAANLKKFDDAIEYANQSIANDPNNIDGFRMKLFALEDTHRLAEAARVEQEIARLQNEKKERTAEGS